MSVTHPLPDKELQWRRSPRLPSQEVRVKSKKSDKSKPWKKRTEKQPLAHAEVGPLWPSETSIIDYTVNRVCEPIRTESVRIREQFGEDWDGLNRLRQNEADRVASKRIETRTNILIIHRLSVLSMLALISWLRCSQLFVISNLRSLWDHWNRSVVYFSALISLWYKILIWRVSALIVESKAGTLEMI